MESDSLMRNSRSKRLPPIPQGEQLLSHKLERVNFADSRLYSQSLSKITTIKAVKDPQTNYRSSAVLKTLKPDLGSLEDFLGYDMGLKKPEELFRSSARVLSPVIKMFSTPAEKEVG